MSFNKLTVIGNLGRDPEIRYTPQGMAVTDFSVATTEKRKDKEGNYNDHTTWFKCTAWGKQAENCAKYLSRGNQVYLEGRLAEEKWTDKEGNERTTLAVNVSDVQFLSKANKEDNGAIEESQPKSKKAKAGDDSDIPF